MCCLVHPKCRLSTTGAGVQAASPKPQYSPPITGAAWGCLQEAVLGTQLHRDAHRPGGWWWFLMFPEPRSESCICMR